MKVQFHGAAGGVTGSKHVVQVAGKKILLDCGMFQGRREESFRLNRQFPFEAREIDAVVLSHAHIDHSGLLPMLVKNGFTGDIFCTPATADILGPMLLDAAHIQEADAEYFLRKKSLREEAVYPIEPLYTTEDAHQTLATLQPRERNKTFEVFPGISATFYNAGHVLGSAQIVLEGDGKKLAFTGDYGRNNRKIIKDPDPIPAADAIITETTYGGRLHEPITETRGKLRDVVKETAQKGGKIIIPSFALERAQEILYDLHILFNERQIPDIPVFVDSPLTTKFTKIFEKNESAFDEKTKEYFLEKQKNPFSFSNLRHTITTEESKALNGRPGPCIIISASGMCEAGRIRHHLKHGLPHPENTVLIVGYQAQHTLGRKLVEKHRMVKIFNRMYPVRAQVKILNGYSGHGDQNDLLRNIETISGLRQIFLVHGDPDQTELFHQKLKEQKKDWQIHIPEPGDEWEI